MTDPIEKLSSLFLKFPGIGRRQAKRFVYHLLTRDDRAIKELTDAISSIRSSIAECSSCHRFFPKTAAKRTALCDICASEQTDHSTVMIVEKDVDLENIKRSGAYHGEYFVLGGTVPFLDKEPDEFIRGKALFDKISNGGQNLKEVIIALSATPEGEHTALYVKKLLAPIVEKHPFTITILGRGLSTGTELEYSDADTLKSALKNRA